MVGKVTEENRMKSDHKAALCRGLALVCALAFATPFAFGGERPRVLAMNPAGMNAPEERVVIAIEGMYCDSCAAGIKAMLKRTPGVVSADVSYERKEAVVGYDQQKTTPEKIVAAISNLGYKASVKSKA